MLLLFPVPWGPLNVKIQGDSTFRMASPGLREEQEKQKLRGSWDELSGHLGL